MIKSNPYNISNEKYKENWDNIFNSEQFKEEKEERKRWKWILQPSPSRILYDKDFFLSLLNSNEKYKYNWSNIFKKEEE